MLIKTVHLRNQLSTVWLPDGSRRTWPHLDQNCLPVAYFSAKTLLPPHSLSLLCRRLNLWSAASTPHCPPSTQPARAPPPRSVARSCTWRSTFTVGTPSAVSSISCCLPSSCWRSCSTTPGWAPFALHAFTGRSAGREASYPPGRNPLCRESLGVVCLDMLDCSAIMVLFP